jgi:hypothetical protein
VPKNDVQDLNRALYDEIIRCIQDESLQSFKFLNISDDIANTILIRLLKDSISETHLGLTQAYVNSAYPKAVEDVFDYYQKVSLHYSLSKTQDPELSNDISQEAIHLLLASKNYINDVYTWLKQLTQNLLCKHYRSILKQKELYDSLCRESELVRKLMCSQSTIQIEGLDPILKKEILSTKEYKEFEAISRFDKISDYATHLNVSHAVAQKRKDKIVKNLRSRLLLAMGWEAGRDILNYNQYNAILKFIRSIQKVGENGDIRGTSSNSLAQTTDTQKVMQGITSIDDWGITMIGNRRFRFHIFHLTPEKTPIIATFIISLSERNHVSIKSCKRDEIAGIHPIPANVQIPKEMGRLLWSYEKIISLLK